MVIKGVPAELASADTALATGFQPTRSNAVQEHPTAIAAFC